MTFASVVAEWLKRDQADNRSHDEVKRILDREVLPAWGQRRIGEIGRREVLELIDASPTAAPSRSPAAAMPICTGCSGGPSGAASSPRTR